MEIRVSALHFSANESQVAFINKKVSRLEKYENGEKDAAEEEKTLQKEDKKIKLTIAGNIIERSASTFEDAITAAVDAMKEKLVREKEKKC